MTIANSRSELFCLTDQFVRDVMASRPSSQIIKKCENIFVVRIESIKKTKVLLKGVPDTRKKYSFSQNTIIS